MLEDIRKKNPDLTIYDLGDEAFKPYGRVLTNEEFDFSSIIAKMEKIEMPEQGDVYYPYCEEVGDEAERNAVSYALYGGMAVQIGYGAGKSDGFSFAEFHQGNEILIWQGPAVALFGHMEDIVNGEYDAEKFEAFYIPIGGIIELYGGTMHGMPFLFDEYFRLCCILPYGTNFSLRKEVQKSGLNRMLVNINSWRIYPKDSRETGCHKGINGSIDIIH